MGMGSGSRGSEPPSRALLFLGASPGSASLCSFQGGAVTQPQRGSQRLRSFSTLAEPAELLLLLSAAWGRLQGQKGAGCGICSVYQGTITANTTNTP